MIDNTDALVTRTPRLALAVVTADCVPLLMADARAGVAAAVHAGRVGAQRGVVTRAVTAMLELGARAGDISALLGPAISGRNYEVPAAMADEVEAALPGSRTTTARRNAGTRPSPRNRLPAKEFRHHLNRHRSPLHDGRRQPVQSSPGRADRAAGVAGLDGVTAMAVGPSDPQSRDSIRESELTHALAAVRSRLATAAERAGRNVGEIELVAITKFFPVTDVAILSRLGCRSVGESREQEASAKVADLTRLVAASPRTDSREVHWHMVGRIQRNKARSLARWAHTAHSIDSSQLVSAPGSGGDGDAGRRPTGKSTARLRSGQPGRRCVPRRRRRDDARGGRRGVCAGRGRGRSAVDRVDGHPAAGLGSRESIWAAAIGAPPHARIASKCSWVVRGHVERLRNRRKTWFDVCACRYRAIGPATATVTLSSHCSHTFITDINNPRG